MIDSKLALEKDIHAGNRHRIYFEPDTHHDRDRVVERRSDSDATVRQERTVRTQPDGDVTVKKETTIKND